MGSLHPYLIGIAGPSCSGKTELARRLQPVLPGESLILALDSYYRDLAHLPLEERARSNFDEPEALEASLLAEHIEALAAGREISKPVYSFEQHIRAPYTTRVVPGDFVLLEGLFALYWPGIRQRFSTKVFVQVRDEVALERRIERDQRERGRTRDSVLLQYASTVRPMCEKYLLPTRQFADVVVDGEGRIEESVDAVLEHVRRCRALA